MIDSPSFYFFLLEQTIAEDALGLEGWPLIRGIFLAGGEQLTEEGFCVGKFALGEQCTAYLFERGGRYFRRGTKNFYLQR